MNITWSEDDEKDFDEDEDEDDKTTADQVTSLTVNLTSRTDSVQNLIADEQEKNLSTQVMIEFLENDKAEIDSQNNILTNILKEKDDQIANLLDELKVSKERIKQLTIGASCLSETLSYGRTPNVKEGEGLLMNLEGVDFDETFAPVARLESIRLLLSVACQMRLKKALYGLKQAPRAWYERLTMFLLEQGYKRGGANKMLFIKYFKTGLIVAQIYVDDIVFGSSLEIKSKEFATLMQNEFEMSMVGELNFFLGLKIKQVGSEIFISQAKYAKNLVKKFGLEQTKSVRTLMATSLKISRDDQGKEVDSNFYRSMIGSLLYLTASRPDISFSVGVCARYQSKPKESHLMAVKRIIRYINCTSNFGLWYTNDTNSHLAGYIDADWTGNMDDRKSTSGGCFYIGNNIIS
ncbi:cysteine-rich RLK (RECEPTOR-like protein kinase) 8 [Abeliophyllum distichum]|uniref:Cysteine-rich RLK (RECEPTOR-like protein kinase) 8 n=1 Tax=Abeliophyllum distichum TaxID=126358 RepID=A0ABD1PQS6_9LAMI